MLNCVEVGKPPTTLAAARQVSEPGDGGATSPAITAVIGERVRVDAGRHQSMFEIALLAEVKELKRAISAQQATTMNANKRTTRGSWGMWVTLLSRARIV